MTELLQLSKTNCKHITINSPLKLQLQSSLVFKFRKMQHFYKNIGENKAKVLCGIKYDIWAKLMDHFKTYSNNAICFKIFCLFYYPDPIHTGFK